MPSTLPRRPRAIKPAVCDSQLISRPVSPCELLPEGLAGEVLINGRLYRAEIIGYLPDVGEPVVEGYRLTATDTHEQHDVSLSHGQLECTCGDFIWRRSGRDPHGCKHCIATRRHLPLPCELQAS